jgi:Uma2 family endonuclease
LASKNTQKETIKHLAGNFVYLSRFSFITTSIEKSQSTKINEMEALQQDRLSILEYIKLERESEERYEFHDGMIYAHAGGSINHSMISSNVFYSLESEIRKSNKKCRTFGSDTKVGIETRNSYLYPDIMVICGKIDKSKTEAEAIVNPSLVVEVLSRGTSDYDRSEKFDKYRSLGSLKEYVLVNQEKPIVEIFERVNDLWRIVKIEGLEELVNFSSVGIEIEMKEIYRDVIFPQLRRV